jgi:tetratricopeptide (TPR) repeat protein
MSGIFWFAIAVMAVAAVAFVAMPLVKDNRKLVLIAVAIALPALAIGLYAKLGRPAAADLSPATQHMSSSSKEAPGGAPAGKIGSVASMLDGLVNRLKENPDDGKSWLLLARSYDHLGRVSEAKDAYERAAALGEFDEKLAGLATSSTPTGAQIAGNVQLSESSKAIVLPTDVVFIFARAVDGPPFPVAVLQRAVSDLPLDFLLNDSQAMNPAAKLSDFEQVVVTARISRSGIATDALQGLEAKSDPIVVAENRHVNLIIE